MLPNSVTFPEETVEVEGRRVTLMILSFYCGETFLKSQNEPVNENAQQMNRKKGANMEYLFRFQSKNPNIFKLSFELQYYPVKSGGCAQ